MSKLQIPVIDLDDNPDFEALSAAYRMAGCFNVTDSGIDQAVTRDLLRCMNDFFRLADDDPVKRAVHRENNAGASGWTPMLEEPAYEPGTVAWVESFDCGLSGQSLAQLPEQIRNTLRPSIWPALPGFRDSARAQWNALTSSAEKIYPLVSLLLKQESGFLARRASSQALNTLRLLNYPPRPEANDGASTGIAAHTDFECITLIHQTAPGLEVKTPGGEWIQVPVAKGQWTVLLGDMIERWSNGVFKATAHRVPVTQWPRQSIVMFMAADAGLDVIPLDAFIGPDNPSRFAPATQDGLIRTAMARAEANRLEMLPEVEKLRAEKLSTEISRG